MVWNAARSGWVAGALTRGAADAAVQAGWLGAAIALSTLASRVTYGLRAEARQVGQYTLEEKLGEGGMGVVYRARHSRLKRPTAVKLLTPGKAGLQTVERFEREVQITARLTHPNTVAVFDYGRTLDGVFYYAMEYLEGVSLERLVAEEGPQPPGRVVHVLQQVAGALGEAHALGLVHRPRGAPKRPLRARRGRLLPPDGRSGLHGLQHRRGPGAPPCTRVPRVRRSVSAGRSPAASTR